MPRHDATIDNNVHNSLHVLGAGTTIEVMTRSDESHVRLSGLAEAIGMLKLPVENLGSGDFLVGTIGVDKKPPNGKVKSSPRSGAFTVVDKGNGYVQLCIPNEIMTRYQLNDVMNGFDWRVEGYSTCYDCGTLVVHELWRKSNKKSSSSPRRESKDLS